MAPQKPVSSNFLFDPNCFDKILGAPEKVNIKYVSAAFNEIDSVA